MPDRMDTEQGIPCGTDGTFLGWSEWAGDGGIHHRMGGNITGWMGCRGPSWDGGYSRRMEGTAGGGC